MPGLTDGAFVARQYQDRSRLDVRSRLHQLYSTNRYGWFRWVRDHLGLSPGMRVLEVGCGDGSLWRNARVTQDRLFVLSDLSVGMVAQTRDVLETNQTARMVADVQSLPLGDAVVQVVIANHMLYHVSESSRAIAEMARVLTPEGRLCATTIGQGHMRELLEWVSQAIPQIAAVWRERQPRGFTLESAPLELDDLFCDIAVLTYPDALHVTEVEPVMAYALSLADGPVPDHAQGRLREILSRELHDKGSITISKQTGMVIARKKSWVGMI